MLINSLNNQNLSENIISLGINIIYNGINTLFMGIQMPDMNRNNNYILNQINDLITQIQNISKTITNHQMPILNMIPFKSNNNLENNNNQKNKPKINVHFFNRNNGENNNIIVDSNTTIDEALKKYLIKINLPQLIKNNNFLFLINGIQLKFGDNRYIDDTFLTSDIKIDVVSKNILIAGLNIFE